MTLYENIGSFFCARMKIKGGVWDFPANPERVNPANFMQTVWSGNARSL